MEALQIQLGKFERSVDRLKEVLKRRREDDEIVLDATIQRFEFVFENAWKSIKLALKVLGIEALSPRECIKKAYRQGWVDDEEALLELLKARNLTSHTYSEPIAESVYTAVKENVPIFEELLKALKGLPC